MREGLLLLPAVAFDIDTTPRAGFDRPAGPSTRSFHRKVPT